MSARKAPHLLKTLDRHQGGQGLTLPLDDEFVMPEGNPVQHVSNSLPDIHRRNLVGHSITPSSIIVALDAIRNDTGNGPLSLCRSPEQTGYRFNRVLKRWTSISTRMQ